MQKTWFTSDPHYGHENIIKYCDRPFKSVKEMDEALIERHNSVVKPNDLIYYLGDVSWYGSDGTTKIFNRLNGKKRLIIGNHDHRKNLKYLFEYISDYELLKMEGVQIAMMHYPILSWYGQSHGVLHFHGHTHNTIDNSGTLRFEVGVDAWNYTPVNLEQIIELIPSRLRQNETELQRPVSKFNALYKKASKDDNRTETERVGEAQKQRT